jgi:transcriptional regulator with XRE-family HTH domain
MPRNRGSDREGRLLQLLAAKRSQARLTQTELARRLGRPQSFVSKYENGERRLDILEFIDVCTALETDSCEMLAAIIQGTAVNPFLK